MGLINTVLWLAHFYFCRHRKARQNHAALVSTSGSAGSNPQKNVVVELMSALSYQVQASLPGRNTSLEAFGEGPGKSKTEIKTGGLGTQALHTRLVRNSEFVAEAQL